MELAFLAKNAELGQLESGQGSLRSDTAALRIGGPRGERRAGERSEKRDRDITAAAA